MIPVKSFSQFFPKCKYTFSLPIVTLIIVPCTPPISPINLKASCSGKVWSSSFPHIPRWNSCAFFGSQKHFLMLAVGEPNIHQSQTLSEQFSIDQDSITPDISQNPVVIISFFWSYPSEPFSLHPASDYKPLLLRRISVALGIHSPCLTLISGALIPKYRTFSPPSKTMMPPSITFATPCFRRKLIIKTKGLYLIFKKSSWSDNKSQGNQDKWYYFLGRATHEMRQLSLKIYLKMII